MRRTKKRITKGKRKFFIILACYITVFILTSVVTLSTMAWFNSSTWQSEVLYMGGPVYIYFSDDLENRTSGEGKLITRMPDTWEKLYPGMNISFEAKAVVEGHTFEQTRPDGDTFIQYTTGAVLRAKVLLDVTAPYDTEEFTKEEIAQQIYDYLWPQLQSSALKDMSQEGVWIFDVLDTDVMEENYFYYVEKGQTVSTQGDYKLLEVGGGPEGHNESIGFLNKAIIQMPPIGLTNTHADCDITFTIVFQAVQAFFPYEEEDVNSPYSNYYATGATNIPTGTVKETDKGLEKPFLVKNSRKIFNEAMWTPDYTG